MPFLYFVCLTYKCQNRLERFHRNKHSSLFDRFVSGEDNKVVADCHLLREVSCWHDLLSQGDPVVLQEDQLQLVPDVLGQGHKTFSTVIYECL